MKRVLTFLLAAFTIGSAWAQVPVNEFVNLEIGLKFKVLDEEAMTVQIGIGNNTTYDARWFGKIVLPEQVVNPLNGLTYTVTAIGQNAFEGAIGITSVTLPATVDSIAPQAFKGCVNLKEVILNDGLLYIDESAFANCINLPEVIIPGTVWHISNYAFSKCSSLEYIYIPESVVKLGDGAFINCGNLRSITLPSSISEVGNSVFTNCSKLETVIMPGVDYVGSFCFKNCTSLQFITANLGDVTYFGESAFEACKSLSNISINSEVRNVGINAFKGTAWYKDLFAAAADGQPVYAMPIFFGFKGTKPVSDVTIDDGTTIIAPEALSGCSRVKNLIIPDDVITIGKAAFRSMESLQNINLPSKLTVIEDEVFANCWNLKTVNNIANITSIGRSAFWACKNLEIDLKNFSKLEYLHDYAFARCDKFVKPNLPSSLKYIGINPFIFCKQITGYAGLAGNPYGYSIKDNMYIVHQIQSNYDNIPFVTEYGCYASDLYIGLRGEYADQPAEGEAPSRRVLVAAPGLISSWKDPGTEFIGREAFRGSVIKGNPISFASTTNVRASAFENAKFTDNNVQIKMPNVYIFEDHSFDSAEGKGTVTHQAGWYYIGISAFANTTILPTPQPAPAGTEIPFGDDNIDGLTPPAFGYHSRAMLSADSDITDSEEEVEYDPVVIGKYAFENNTGLESFVLPEGLKEISEGTFMGSSLTSIVIPESVTSIGKKAFNNCENLTVAEGLEHVNTIGDYAFAGTKLNSLVISENATSIGEYAFADVPLTEVKTNVVKPFEISDNTFSAEVFENAALYIPDGTKEAYEATWAWNMFKNIIGGENEEENNITETTEPSEAEANGINEITNSDASVQKRFDLNGQMTNAKGLNIIRMSNGQVRKVMVK